MQITSKPAWLLLLALLAVAVRGHAHQPLLIAVDSHSPPFAFENAQRQPQRIYVGILQAVAQRSGVPLQVRAMPWRRAMQGLDLSQHGVAGLYKNAERAARYLYSDPIWQEDVHLFTLPASSLQAQRAEQLVGTRLGTLAGWYYSDTLQQMQQRGEVVLETSESDAQNIGKLRARRLDGVLAVKDSVHYLLQHHPRQRQALRDGGLVVSNATYIALPFTPGNVVLMDRINTALRQMGTARSPATTGR